MIGAAAAPWPQPLAPVLSLALSAAVAVIPLAVVLVLMGVFRRSGLSSNILFGNLQVATARQLHLNPILLAATNSSGAVAGKMISPQNICVGVTTVGLIGHEGEMLRSTFWHSVAFVTFIGAVACAQTYLVPWMVP